MAKSWQDAVIQQAELISSRLRELLSSGLGLFRTELGVDLGLKPELYPSWVILLTAVVGLLLVVLSWAAACSGLFRGRRRGAPANDGVSDGAKDPTKTVRTEEQKKRTKKKPNEKNTESNGRMPPELQEADKVREEITKPFPEVKAEKAKKNKKKSKTEDKPVLNASSPNGKEPDEGTWETKVSNREKRQQRRKDKAPGDESGSPGGTDPPLRVPAELLAVPPAPAGPRKSRGEPLHTKHGKGDAILSHVTANWSEGLTVNGGGWNNMAMQLPNQMSSLDGEKWPNILKEPPHAWGHETAGSWSGLDGRLKKDLNPVSLPVSGLNTTEAVSPPAAVLQCYSQPPVDDQWSGLNGMGDVDPSSDWNPPSELWGNYEEPQPEISAPHKDSAPQKDSAPEIIKVFDDEKEKGDVSKGDGKSKKKKKKKKQEDAGAALQESLSQKPSSQVPHRLSKPETLLPTAKQNSTPPSSQKKSEENCEPPKQVQMKKKARRET